MDPLPPADLRPFIPIRINEKVFHALVDTGSMITFAGHALRQEFILLELPMEEYERPIHMANNNRIITSEHYTVTLNVGDKVLTGVFTYLPGLPEDALIGMDLLRESGLQMFVQGKQVNVPVRADVPDPEPELSSSTSPEQEDIVGSSYSGMPRRSENNKPKVPKDPFQGITLKGKRHYRMFTIYRPWGNISVRMNKKGNQATLKWRKMMKTINLSK